MIVDIVILALAFGIAGLIVFNSVRLRVLSNKLSGKRAIHKKEGAVKKAEISLVHNKIDDRKTEHEILRIFDEMEKKAGEVNPVLLESCRAYNTNEALTSYRDFIYNTTNESLQTTSNHITI